MPRYDVAFTFAGEDRELVAPIATGLRDLGYKVFYDEFEISDLWGRNLYEYLHELYFGHARYCVVMVSKHYASKQWTRLERRAAQARVFQEEDSQYILPIRVDDTTLPGLPPTVGYVEIALGTAAIVKLLQKKLGPPKASTEDPND